MKNIKISICIPTFNRADLLPYTLQSVANQTVSPDEVIIIDNASTDNTAEIVGHYKKYGFTYVRNKKNIGMAGNYNRCIELASNEFFTFLPSDDLIAPTWYEEWSRVLKIHRADLYTSPITIMNKKYKPIWSFPIFSRSRMIKQPHVMREFCRKDVAGLPPSAASIYRKDIFNNVDKFKHSEGAECDVRVAMRLLDICDVYYYHRYLFVFRNHDMRSFDIQKETRSSTIVAKIDNFFRILHDIYRTRYGNSDAYRYILQATVLPTLCNVNLYLIYGRFKTIIQVYKSCFSHFPDILRRLEDWYPFMRIQLYLVKRGLTMYRIPTSIKQQVRWLEYMGDL